MEIYDAAIFHFLIFSIPYIVLILLTPLCIVCYLSIPAYNAIIVVKLL